METKTVKISKKAVRELKKVPLHIAMKLRSWIESVNECGLMEVRRLKGFHDEGLQGQRRHQRSIRLSKGYRAFYTEHDNCAVEISYIEIDEVNKHDY
jgi:proteic killer suppression protein